jgi:hypothetical protein
MPPDAAVQLAAGRKALNEGDLPGALAAFRNARLDPGQAAAACNGLAIVYSRLGRDDLAERFFGEAISLAPDEPKYRMNLAQFYRLHPIIPLEALAPTVAQPGAMQRQAVVSVQSGPRRISQNIMAYTPESRMTRVSAAEVRVTGGSPSSPAKARPGYPVRVALASGQSAIHVEKRPVYPVSITIGH